MQNYVSNESYEPYPYFDQNFWCSELSVRVPRCRKLQMTA